MPALDGARNRGLRQRRVRAGITEDCLLSPPFPASPDLSPWLTQVATTAAHGAQEPDAEGADDAHKQCACAPTGIRLGELFPSMGDLLSTVAPASLRPHRGGRAAWCRSVGKRAPPLAPDPICYKQLSS